MKIAICDDVVEQISAVKSIISQKIEEEIEFFTYSNGNDLIKDNKEYNFDLICLDIEMPEIDGFETASKIRENHEDAVIVFVTSKNSMVFDAFTFRPFDFVRKDSFEKDMTKTLKNFVSYIKNQNKFLVLQNTKETVRWKITEITYIESVKNDIILHRKNDSFSLRGNLKKKESELSGFGFIRVHSGYLVNYRFIEKFEKTNLILTDKTVIPISRNRYAKSKEKLRDLIINERN